MAVHALEMISDMGLNFGQNARLKNRRQIKENVRLYCYDLIAGNVHALPKCRNRIPVARPRRNFVYLRRLANVQ